MKTREKVVGCFTVALCVSICANVFAQNVRRAQPAEDVPVARAVPFDPQAGSPTPKFRSSVPPPTPPNSSENQADQSPAPVQEEAQDKRQLDYANALFSRKLYDLAVPEYEKFLGQFPGAPGRASAYFYLAECYRSLNRNGPAKTSFQGVLDNYGESEFAGPAAYGIAEILFTQKDFNGALPLFHRAAAKTKEPALALSAHYFEARCLENTNQKDEAQNVYQQVAETKNPNPYREDARMAAGTIALARGRKADAFHNYEALANEASKPALKAEATVRAGMVAVDLIQSEKGKPNKEMAEKATALLQKGRTLPDAGKWRTIAEVGLLRLQYQSGQYTQLLAEYQRGQTQIPEDVRPEMMLIVGNSHRQLGHVKEADAVYRDIIAKYPNREESRDAAYQRLINFYNSNDPSLLSEVDQFLQSNPTAERADQAKLLKAEYYYRQQNFTEAAPIYEDLRASQLSPKLRGEAAYKLGWCEVQLKDTAKVLDAFGYFLKAFPDNPQVPPALMQRALALQETKNYEPAIADLNNLLTNFPSSKEREAALQQKALIFGQLENAKGMSDAFKQLLKEFPKSSIAAQANYYIGKVAFEAKDYKAALSALEAARGLDKDQYYNLATLRIISTYFYLKDRANTSKEVDAFLAANSSAHVPSEILEWLGIEFYNEKNYPAAEKYLTVLSQSDNLSNVKPDFWFYLAESQTKQNHFSEAETSYEKYLQVATDPAAKAKTLLALGATKIADHKPDDAQKIAQEIMTLQPEGRVNAEARLLAGDVQLEREHYEEAGKAFMSVALLYDDPAITPRALQKAADAYQKAGKPEEAERAAKQLHEKYPNYAGG